MARHGKCWRRRTGGWFPTPELAVTAATVMCWYVLVALFIAAVGRFLTTRVSRIIDAAAGTILGVLIAGTGWRPWLPRWQFRQ
jgi:threonine/homoserine/homoserine lactone efflux protein